MVRLLLAIWLTVGSATLAFCKSQGDALSVYYHFVHRADMAIARSDYKAAANLYDSAFALQITPFALDVYNASVCAALNEDYNRLQFLSKALISKGADTGFFRKAIFHSFIASRQWKEVLVEYPALVQHRNQMIDTAIVSRIKAFVRRDQAVHCMLPKNVADEEFIRKMHREDDSLSESLRDLFVQHNFLGEDIIGANFRDTVLSPQPIYGALVMHQFQKHGAILKAAIDTAIRLGKLHAEIGLRWVEFGQMGRMNFLGEFFVYRDTLRSSWQHTDTASSLYKLNDKFFARLLSQTPSNEVLALRNYYYVDDARSIHKRIAFQLQHLAGRKYPPFLFPLSLSIVSYSSKQAETNAIRNSRVIATVR